MANQAKRRWQERLHEIIYESNTAEGKAFDVSLLLLILTSIIVVMMDSVKPLHASHGSLFLTLEWVFTGLFTIEYLLRLICIKKPWKYVFSFLGLIDLLAIIPSYLSIFVAGAQSLLVFRALRLMRIFRIFMLSRYLSEMQFLGVAIKGSARKISIFMLMVLTLVIIMGSVMYLVEQGQNGFNSIPDSIYWAIVTITTVGYGDISPATPAGKLVASMIMLMGYAIIAVPTGIVTTEMALASRKKEQKAEACLNCGREGHDLDARFCKFCGGKL
jgi:voltage-gated potassium channel